MHDDQQTPPQDDAPAAAPAPEAAHGDHAAEEQEAAQALDQVATRPEQLSPEELRLMADTMPGEGPGD
jgi:hypothetical protein